MRLAKEVKQFSSGCEGLLSAIEENRPLTEDEASMIKYYCKELLDKIEQRLPKN